MEAYCNFDNMIHQTCINKCNATPYLVFNHIFKGTNLQLVQWQLTFVIINTIIAYDKLVMKSNFINHDIKQQWLNEIHAYVI